MRIESDMIEQNSKVTSKDAPKTYTKPRLVEHGRVEEITKGAGGSLADGSLGNTLI